MKTLRILAPAAALLALGVCLGSMRAPAVAQEKAAATKWEYKVASPDLDTDIEKELNKLGKEGWEIAGTTSRVHGGGGMQTTTSVCLIFKRAKK